MSDDYLIWSNEHEAWWAPDGAGYVLRVEHAGRYAHAKALEICTDAMPGRRGYEPLREIPVQAIDVEFMLQRFAGTYPGHDAEPPEH